MQADRPDGPSPSSQDHAYQHYAGVPGDLVLERNVGLLVKHVHTLLHRIIDLRAGPMGLTANQWRPLLLIQHRGTDTPAELARALDIDTGATTRMLDRLESKGFVQRERVPEDRRVVKIVLTDMGRTVSSQILPIVAQALNIHLSGFSEDEIRMLIALLKRMIMNGEHYLQQQTADRPDKP
ncbi:MAG: MarR family winged helix-turn-helix transcriptional regulator [Castellaniella sp.]|uniref:MarR family winged helix-turn-helix transcriptional regulator n=1 Tax=Castellaniella sp. TaxID=1955812 RepID=UPI003A8793AF